MGSEESPDGCEDGDVTARVHVRKPYCYTGPCTNNGECGSWNSGMFCHDENEWRQAEVEIEGHKLRARRGRGSHWVCRGLPDRPLELTEVGVSPIQSYLGSPSLP